MPRKNEVPAAEKQIGKRLRLFRSALELTQADFGRKAGIERPTLVKYELGLSPIPWRTGEFLCKTFHLNAVWLVTGIGPTEPYVVPPSLPSAAELAGQTFSNVVNRFFLPCGKSTHSDQGFSVSERVPREGRIWRREKSPSTKVDEGSRVGITLSPTNTNTSYEVFKGILEKLDATFLEMRDIEDRRALAEVLWDVYGDFTHRIGRHLIPSLILKATRDLPRSSLPQGKPEQ